MPIKKPNISRAADVLSWLTNMTSPEVLGFLRSEEPVTHEAKRVWLRSEYAATCPLLAINTSKGEAHSLAIAGLLEGDHGPAVLNVRDKHATILTCHPRYRLTRLGRRWCLAAYSDLPRDERNHLGVVLQEVLARPTHVEKLRDTLRKKRGISPCFAAWKAIVALGCGLDPDADAGTILTACDAHRELVDAGDL